MSGDGSDLMIREATAAEVAEVLSILEASMLSVSTDHVRSLIASGGDGGTGRAGTVLLAVDGGRSLGALVLDGAEVEAVAVRPKRRNQGIGTALIEAASERIKGPLVASFDADVRPFYERLGFEVEAIAGEDRYRGTFG